MLFDNQCVASPGNNYTQGGLIMQDAAKGDPDENIEYMSAVAASPTNLAAVNMMAQFVDPDDLCFFDKQLFLPDSIQGPYMLMDEVRPGDFDFIVQRQDGPGGSTSQLHIKWTVERVEKLESTGLTSIHGTDEDGKEIMCFLGKPKEYQLFKNTEWCRADPTYTNVTDFLQDGMNYMVVQADMFGITQTVFVAKPENYQWVQEHYDQVLAQRLVSAFYILTPVFKPALRGGEAIPAMPGSEPVPPMPGEEPTPESMEGEGVGAVDEKKEIVIADGWWKSSDV